MNNKYKGRLKKKCPACKAAVLAGMPVNPILGIKVLTDETDFVFSGILPPRLEPQLLDDAAEKRLMSKIDEYKKKGAGAWTLGGPCSSFARDAWKAGTGEDLNSNTLGGLGPVSNPNSLRKSIIKANAVAASPRKNSSASFGSSGRSSGSSSLNSSGSSL